MDLTLGVAVGGHHRLEIFDGGRWRPADYAPGACGLTPPYETDRLRWNSEQPFDTAHLFFPGRLVEKVAEELRRAGQRSAAASLSELMFEDAMVATTVRVLLAAARAGAPDLYAEQAARWVATHLLTTRAGAELQADDPRGHLLTDARLARVIALIRARYGRQLSLDELASEAGVSKFHFARLFRARTGRAPHAFLTDTRMAAARHLLHGSDLPVARVAERCGYKRPNPFSAMFRRAHGMTPTEYRQRRTAISA